MRNPRSPLRALPGSRRNSPIRLAGPLLLALCLLGCDAFLTDNPNNCVLTPTACGDTQRCSLVTRRCTDVTTAARRPSRSSTIALSEDGARVSMVNPEDGSLSTFRTDTLALTSRARTGAEPSAVVLSPDGLVAYVANRADANVVKVEGLSSAAPRVSPPVKVGAEPTGLALSPSGALLFVAEWAEGRVSVIDTEFMTVVNTLAVPAPRALAVTNNGDLRDEDETLVVPAFYGSPEPGGEARDNGRVGKVHLFSLRGLTEGAEITLSPLSAGEAGFGVGTAPNALGGLVVQGRRLFVTSVSASPAGAPRFDQNVNPVVYVADLVAGKEIRGGAGTTNLARKLAEAPGTDPRFFLADLVDIDMVPGKNGVGYVVARGADVVQRVVFDDARGEVTVGSTMNLQIDVTGPSSMQGCRGPSGIAVRSSSQAFVNCWVNRRLGVLDFDTQRLATVIPAADLTEDTVVRGRAAFYSARGRWSKDAWSSCASCHPDGLSDNITWSFPAGPRQTISLDGSFTHGTGAQGQRLFNWTATADEVHDSDLIVRAVAGGLGALTRPPAGPCGNMGDERQIAITGDPLAVVTKEVQAMSCTTLWDDIEAYLKTLRPPRGRQGLDEEEVRTGRALFAGRGGCARCHGGAGWTVSRRFYTPTAAVVSALQDTVPFSRPAAWPASYTAHSTTQIAVQPGVADDKGPAQGVRPLQAACAIRNVGSFGVGGNPAAGDVLEVKSDGGRAQGRGGYNVPSLYGLGLGAPYLHHGQARTLEELFTDAGFLAHAQSGAANFLLDEDANQQRAALVAFLLSIDATTAEIAVPAGFAEGCRAQ